MNEIVNRMKIIGGKQAIVFNTARFTSKRSLDYMKAKVEEAGAQVTDQARFQKLFKIGVKNVIIFGKQINEK